MPIDISELIDFLETKKEIGIEQIEFQDIEEFFKEKEELWHDKFIADMGTSMTDFIDRYDESFIGDETWRPNEWFKQHYDINKIDDYNKLKKIIWEDFSDDRLRIWLLKEQCMEKDYPNI